MGRPETSSCRANNTGGRKCLDYPSFAVRFFLFSRDLSPFFSFAPMPDLVDASFWGFSQEKTIGWLRQSEVKHGRIAMAGT
jgi:hypothetical protein